MAFTPLLSLIVAEMLGYLPESWSAVELGNQRFSVDDETLERISLTLEKAGRDEYAASLRKLAKIDLQVRKSQVDQFFAAIGAESYVAIDVNEKFGSLPMDLNKSLRRDYGFGEQFDLVMNNGTGEHIFDQRAVFENMHDLCKPGGIIVNILPFGSFLNHGFFSFHPTLYLDLAAINNYEILGIGAGNRWGTLGFMSGPASRGLIAGEQIPFKSLVKPIMGRDVYGSPPLRWLRRALGRRGYYKDPRIRLDIAVQHVMEDSCRRNRTLFGDVFAIGILRKASETAFQIPFQGRFVPNLEDVTIAESYGQAPQRGIKATS